MNSLGRNTRINILANAVLGALGIASGSIVSYRYGAGQRGAIGVSQVLAALSASLGALGLGDAILHMLAKRRRITLAQLLGYALLTIPIAGLLGVGGGIAVAKISGDLFAVGKMAYFCAALGASGAVFSLLGGALRGLSDFIGWNALRIAGAVAWILALLIRDGDNFDPVRAATLYAALMGLVCVAQALRLRSLLAGRAREITLDNSPGLRLLLKFGLPSAFASTPLLLNARLDQVALGLVANKIDVGHYVAAVGYCWATVPLGQAIATQAATTIAATTNPLREIQKLCRLGGAVILGSGIVAWILAPVAIGWLNGKGFESSVGLARILLIGTTMQGVTYLLEEVSRGLGAPKLALRAEMAGLISMAVLLFALASRGGTATAIASSIGYFVSAGVAARAASRLVGVPIHALVRRDPTVTTSASESDPATEKS